MNKTEIIAFLDSIVKKYSEVEVDVFCVANWIDDDIIKQAIGDSASGKEAYIKLGKALSVIDLDFDGIVFREDCYDYLISKGFGEEEAFGLMEVIRKGQYRFERYQINSDKLSDKFYDWAKGVMYLPSRKMLQDMLGSNV